MSRILLLDDHAPFREALAAVLGREPDLEVVAKAGSLAEARAGVLTRLDEVDVAVVDLLLPDGSGTELIGELREASPDASVLVLTIVMDRETRDQALAVGADEIVIKEAPLEEIVAAVRRLGEERVESVFE